MQYQSFGPSGMQVSRFCLGAMTFGNKLEEDQVGRVVDEALDHGVNFIDTADSYGHSEEVLGRTLDPAKRERVYLATKVFRQFCRDKRVGRNSRTNILNSLHRSLRLLQTDYVDLYMLHHPDADTPLEETLETLDTIVKQGLARYVGVSNHYAWQMSYMIARAGARHLEPIISLQANYNILDRQIERETVPFLQRFGLGLMCYGPLCGGLLTGKYGEGTSIPDNTRATKHKGMQEYLADERNHRILTELRAMAEEADLTMNQLAILWLLSKPWATTVLLGGSKPEHFSQIYPVADRELEPQLVERIDELSEARIWTPFHNQGIRQGAALAPAR